MKDQLQTIREALENSSDLIFKDVTKSHLRAQAFTTLAQLEAMVGEPVAWLYESPMPDGSVFVGASAERLKIGIGVTPDSKEYPLYRAAPVAQQPQTEDTIKRQAQKIAELTADRDGWIEAHARLYREYHDFRKAAPQQAEAVPSDVVRDAYELCPSCRNGDLYACTCTHPRNKPDVMLPDFIAFARDVLADFPHGFPDSFDLNDLAIKHGLLTGKTVAERCGELCNCAEYHGEDELKGGVTCYHRHAAIAQQKGQP